MDQLYRLSEVWTLSGWSNRCLEAHCGVVSDYFLTVPPAPVAVWCAFAGETAGVLHWLIGTAEAVFPFRF
ncbi:MAG TPA: hypothetical protein DCR20_13030 [Planctomycetaceae bacterium]|nr:hypothetical protein [Planctomycetaceae bacterium]